MQWSYVWFLSSTFKWIDQPLLLAFSASSYARTYYCNEAHLIAAFYSMLMTNTIVLFRKYGESEEERLRREAMYVPVHPIPIVVCAFGGIATLLWLLRTCRCTWYGIGIGILGGAASGAIRVIFYADAFR
jgi:hypothetical protein